MACARLLRLARSLTEAPVNPQAQLSAARLALDAWSSVFRDDPCCEGAAPGAPLAQPVEARRSERPTEPPLCTVPARVADALLALRGAERDATEAASSAGRRCTALATRCDLLEVEASELRAALHAAQPAARHPEGDDARLLLDPGAAKELARLSSALEAANEALKAKDEELAALAFSKESKQGRMLMARVRTLIKENEEFGAQVSEGRLHALQTQIELLKAHAAALKRDHAELAHTAAQLSAENEELQLRAFGRAGGEGAVESQPAEAMQQDVEAEQEEPQAEPQAPQAKRARPAKQT